MKLHPNQTTNPLQQNINQPPLELKPGQIFYGKVRTIDPYGNAIVHSGTRQIVAKIEARIDVKESYWFIVNKEEGRVLLKLIPDRQNENSLLRYFKLPSNAEMHTILSAFSKWGLVTSKEDLLLYNQWLQNTSNKTAALDIIKQIHNNQYPKNEVVFNSLLALESHPSLVDLLEQLSTLINQNASKVDNSVSQMLNLLLGHSKVMTHGPEGITIKNNLIQIFQVLGYIKSDEKAVTIFEELLKIIQTEEPSPHVRTVANQIINFLLGTKLITINEEQWFQWSFAFPLPIFDKPVDTSIQWRGKKLNKAESNQQFAQIIIDLQLPSLGKTLVSINVQNQIITINCKSDYQQLEIIGKPLVEVLQNKLEETGYYLSTVKFEKLTFPQDNKNLVNNHSINQINKVDITI